MFTKELSSNLLKILNEKKLTVSALSELTHMSRNHMNNIISQKQVLSVEMLENICSGLEVNPDELLLSDKSKQKDKSKPMKVTQIVCSKGSNNTMHSPICPDCGKKLIKDNQAFCDKCGRRLSWREYSKAEMLYL